MSENSIAPIPRGARALVLGFATALVLWAAAFVCRVPPIQVSSAVLGAILVFILFAGGMASARLRRASIGDGARLGLVASAVNLLLLGSILSDRASDVVPALMFWVPGFLACGAALGAAGALVGRLVVGRLDHAKEEPEWTGAFSRVALFSTLALIGVGGLVTSKDAGLAVVDWPNSYGYNMFLYPLSKMTGNIFFEHSHRLFGSFVGLTTLVLFLRILRTDGRRYVRWAAALALFLVIGQGILGGLRVTGHFTTSTSPEIVRPNLTLALVHGVVAQIFFALLATIAVFTSRTWKERERAGSIRGGSSEATLARLLMGALLFQLFLGVHVRHLGRGTLVHICFAVVVFALALILAMRLLANASVSPILRRTGAALLAHTGTQLLLGIGALIATGMSGLGNEGEVAPSSPGLAAALLPTLHQTMGAILLANAAVSFWWSRAFLSESAPDLAPATFSESPTAP